MSLKIVHLATDAIAGMPFRLVKILQENTPFQVRLIETKHRDSYPQDLVFKDNIEVAIDLINSADIIHLHNNLDLESSAFSPVDFSVLAEKGTRFVRQFHSEPSVLARKMNCSTAAILNDSLPSIVLGQFQERYYPEAMVVPNPIPVSDPDYMPFTGPLQTDILFSPSKKISAWSDRWNTKGAPETAKLLKKMEKLYGCNTVVISGVPLERVLFEKQRSYIILEEMITGSYHLSGLEGLSMGKPTLCYLDRRTEFIMRYLSGADTLPFINTMLEHSQEVISYLLAQRDVGQKIGTASRNWMEKYWSEKALVHHFQDMYIKLMDNPELVCRQSELRIVDEVSKFRFITQPDLTYGSRQKNRYMTSLRIRIANFFMLVKKKLKRKKKRFKEN